MLLIVVIEPAVQDHCDTVEFQSDDLLFPQALSDHGSSAGKSDLVIAFAIIISQDCSRFLPASRKEHVYAAKIYSGRFRFLMEKTLQKRVHRSVYPDIPGKL